MFQVMSLRERLLRERLPILQMDPFVRLTAIDAIFRCDLRKHLQVFRY